MRSEKGTFIFYQVYLIDQPCRGRSPWHKGIDGDRSTPSTHPIESHCTATAKYNLWPQAALHTQWPGTGTKGDPVFDAFYRSIVPSLVSRVEAAELMKAAGSELLDKIGVGHSDCCPPILNWSCSPPFLLLTHSLALWGGYWEMHALNSSEPLLPSNLTGHLFKKPSSRRHLPVHTASLTYPLPLIRL